MQAVTDPNLQSLPAIPALDIPETTPMKSTPSPRPEGRFRPALPNFIFASRWLQLPLYLGLIVAQCVYVFHFWVELTHLIEAVFGDQEALQTLVTSIGYNAGPGWVPTVSYTHLACSESARTGLASLRAVRSTVMALGEVRQGTTWFGPDYRHAAAAAGTLQHHHAATAPEGAVETGCRGVSGGRCRVRTCDPCRVKAVLYR